MKNISKRIAGLALALVLLCLPLSPAFAAGDSQARDTDFFTPIAHTELNYDEIAYEHIDPAPLLAEAAALRELMGDGANTEALKPRLLALGDALERLTAMEYIVQNRQYADSKDAWAAEEVETVDAERVTVEDAFGGLIRDVLSSPCAAALDGVLDESGRERYRTYRDKSKEEIALLARETALESEYMSKIVDEYTVAWEGAEYTEDSAYDALLAGELDDDAYVQVSRLLAKAKNAAVGDIYVAMINVRNQIAKLSGYDSYADYAYKETYQRDYGPEDAQRFCDAVKQYILPKASAYDLLYQEPDQAGLPEGIAYSGTGMFDTLFPYFALLSDELLESARYTYDHRAYDVDPAPNKTGTAYSAVLPYYQLPFYFNNASGGWYDLTSTIHELGHNNVAYWFGERWDQPMLVYDTAEVHSQGLELLMLRFYPELFGTQAEAVAHSTTASILGAIVEGCLFDEFQRRVYALPNVTLEQVNRTYRQICEEYGYVEPEDERTEMYGWYGVPHNFTSPMYYISYATSAAGALAFWEQAQEDYFAAVDDYLRFCALGYSCGFAESFEAVGKPSPMSGEYLADLAQTVHTYLLPLKPYTDVYADDWFGEAVWFADRNGLMNGMGGGVFCPDGLATREQSMTVLARLSDEREEAEEPYTLDEGVAWAMEAGISDGADRTATLTREQFVTMLYRYVQPEVGEEAGEIAFTDDAAVSDWAKDAVRWAVAAGIVNGTDDGSLAPRDSLTRAQMAAMLERCVLAA